MRISDWSSDVCSSDLPANRVNRAAIVVRAVKAAVAIAVAVAANAAVLRAGIVANRAKAARMAATLARSEARRGGEEGVRTCRSRWWPKPQKKKTEDAA